MTRPEEEQALYDAISESISWQSMLHIRMDITACLSHIMVAEATKDRAKFLEECGDLLTYLDDVVTRFNLEEGESE